jgi:hydroxypyruvate reductase
LYDAAVAAAAPGPATARAVEALQINRDARVWLFAFGKAAYTMAGSAAGVLLRSLNSIVGGVVVGADVGPAPYPTLLAMRGDHPIPGRHSFAAAAKIGEVAAGRRSSDVAVVLISGGTTSLIGAPLRGMSEANFTELYELVLGAGLDIVAMNAVRKRFSRWSAGRLAQALAPAATYCFAISDVPSDNLSVIGSGPCVADATTVQDVRNILDRARLAARIPQPFRDHLAAVARGTIPETLRAAHPAFAHVTARVIGNIQLALNGAAARARARYPQARIEVSATRLSGPASLAGEAIAGELLAARQSRANGNAPTCMIWGGETTVALQGNEATTDGGRCQELALAVARLLSEAGDNGSNITLLAAGTDGRDGATDAAGAVVDATTWERIAGANGSPGAALAAHASHRALRLADSLIPRRDTGTNVTDIVIGLVA